MIKRSLSDWLDYIASVHPREIELGLERVREVAQRMQLSQPQVPVVTVAGTNGKGSCVAAMEAMVQASGLRSGTYTSPHLHVFNERIHVNGEMASDASICAAFEVVDSNRQGVSLSYFEYATLAALWIFQQEHLDVVLLEVGLGGRLDAVNMVDADVAVITSISFDHQDWLGSDLEAIGGEKAGIMREKRVTIFGSEIPPPASIPARAAKLQSPLLLLGQDFGYRQPEDSAQWDWFGKDRDLQAVQHTGLPCPGLALSNVSAALQALCLLPLQLHTQALASALTGLQLAGRFERRLDKATACTVLLDVAHNPAGAVLLASNLKSLRARQAAPGRIIAVLAVLADKDIEAIVSALESCVDFWYIAQVETPRNLPVAAAVKRISAVHAELELKAFDSVQSAYVSACEQASTEDMVLVTGSFYTVAAVRAMSNVA